MSARGNRQQHERREHERIPFNRLVRIHTSTSRPQHVIGINYSLSGLALQVNQPFYVGERLHLQFRLADDATTALEVIGEVMHNHQAGEVYTTGLRFVSMVTAGGG